MLSKVLGIVGTISKKVLEKVPFDYSTFIVIDNRPINLTVNAAIETVNPDTDATDYSAGSIIADIFIIIERVINSEDDTLAIGYKLSDTESLIVTLTVDILDKVPS